MPRFRQRWMFFVRLSAPTGAIAVAAWRLAFSWGPPSPCFVMWSIRGSVRPFEKEACQCVGVAPDAAPEVKRSGEKSRCRRMSGCAERRSNNASRGVPGAAAGNYQLPGLLKGVCRCSIFSSTCCCASLPVARMGGRARSADNEREEAGCPAPLPALWVKDLRSSG